MQAYGWSLPARASIDGKAPVPTVPVPVYCRPLFEHENNLRLSCASTVDWSFDPNIAPDCATLIDQSRFGNFKSSGHYKTSCIWICNQSEKDSHICVLDANRPGEILEQFTVRDLKIHCLQTVAGKLNSSLPNRLHFGQFP